MDVPTRSSISLCADDQGRSRRRWNHPLGRPIHISSPGIDPLLQATIGTVRQSLKLDRPSDPETSRRREDEDFFQAKNSEKKPEASKKIQAYSSVKEPTASVKKHREEELDKEKKEKIAKGFYQSKSDEDDTLENINSLKMEESEASRRKKQSEKKAKEKK